MAAKFRLLIVVIGIICANGIVAKERTQLTMVAMTTDQGITADKTGLLDIMIQAVADRSGISHDYQVTSPMRAKRKFLKKAAMCIFPRSLHVESFNQKDVLNSSPFVIIKYFAFTRSNQPIVEDISQLSGKIIGISKHMNLWKFEEIINAEQVTYVQVSSVEKLVDLLKAGRIDIAIHDHLAFLGAANAQQLNFHFNLDWPVMQDSLVISCHKNRTTEAYLQQINPYLEDVLRSGLDEFYQSQPKAYSEPKLQLVNRSWL